MMLNMFRYQRRWICPEAAYWSKKSSDFNSRNLGFTPHLATDPVSQEGKAGFPVHRQTWVHCLWSDSGKASIRLHEVTTDKIISGFAIYIP